MLNIKKGYGQSFVTNTQYSALIESHPCNPQCIYIIFMHSIQSDFKTKHNQAAALLKTN